MLISDRDWIVKTIAKNDKDGDGGISLVSLTFKHLQKYYLPLREYCQTM